MDVPLVKQDIQQEARRLFEKQRQFASRMAQTTASERIERLNRLYNYLLSHLEEAQEATYRDFRKPAAETMLGEIYVLTSEIKYTSKHLRRWMKPQKVPTPLGAIGTSSYIQYEAKGNALIISPWNYPINLALKPLISAIAAGCVAIIKPSELTPHSSAFVRKVVEAVFPPEEVAVMEGGMDVSQALLALPFNHIFFTGSPQVGKIVMKAAAEHLASVTLELGGKSPTIVDETADIAATAQKIAWGKFLNNGQTCIAPDYVMVHSGVKSRFIDEFRKAVASMYNQDGKPTEDSDSYARIVNDRHFQRLKSYLDDAINKGASVELGGKTIAADNFIEPTLITGVNDSMMLMQEEIFGPLLPVMEYHDLREAVNYINAHEKPLALYVHSRSDRNADYVLSSTSAGNALVNELLFQFGNPEIPFGGVNNSGIGKSNGYFGFQEFSNAKGVMKRKFGTTRFLYPPYTDKIKKLLNFMVRYL
ncbi:aldehyde dehydrogenase family protein [Telluribacter sp. SYSU D00476]|uniref:aldehyde dehydrogenase family protein n=1 Tax=Telluribacter sp. SYSU D00476 TaxID=2811430 RepID=UPI001FF51B7E|nr:aldehyde dehydrogenase family protein [Telluribacter sp. SYSU D00476]